MGIDCNAGNLEGMAQYYVGRLPADPGKPNQLFHGGRYLAMTFLDKLPGATLQTFCLRAEKPQGADVLFDRLRRGSRKAFGIGIVAKELGRNSVDRFVRALSRKNNGDKQLERVSMRQRAFQDGIDWSQTRSDSARPRRFLV
jgi:hypothetical protein